MYSLVPKSFQINERIANMGWATEKAVYGRYNKELSEAEKLKEV